MGLEKLGDVVRSVCYWWERGEEKEGRISFVS